MQDFATEDTESTESTDRILPQRTQRAQRLDSDLATEKRPEAVSQWLEIMLMTAVLMPDVEGGYVATNPETGTTTQGESIDEALNNLREATELYLEEFPSVLK